MIHWNTSASIKHPLFVEWWCRWSTPAALVERFAQCRRHWQLPRVCQLQPYSNPLYLWTFCVYMSLQFCIYVCVSIFLHLALAAVLCCSITSSHTSTTLFADIRNLPLVSFKSGKSGEIVAVCVWVVQHTMPECQALTSRCKYTFRTGGVTDS